MDWIGKALRCSQTKKGIYDCYEMTNTQAKITRNCSQFEIAIDPESKGQLANPTPPHGASLRSVFWIFL